MFATRELLQWDARTPNGDAANVYVYRMKDPRDGIQVQTVHRFGPSHRLDLIP